MSPIRTPWNEIIIYTADSTQQNCVIRLIQIHRVENIRETDDPILRITLEWSLLIKAGGTSVHAVWNTPSISAWLLIVWGNLVSRRRVGRPTGTGAALTRVRTVRSPYLPDIEPLSPSFRFIVNAWRDESNYLFNIGAEQISALLPLR